MGGKITLWPNRLGEKQFWPQNTAATAAGVDAENFHQATRKEWYFVLILDMIATAVVIVGLLFL